MRFRAVSAPCLGLLAALAIGCTQEGDKGPSGHSDDTGDSGEPTESRPTDTHGSGSDDFDKDGVLDAWEVSGYFWDGSAFQEWTGQDGVRVFHTDPTYTSTDQDPYPDGMEASGVGMPEGVAAPGNDPLVPAFPNIVATLVSYEARPTGKVTLTNGSEVAMGTAISATTERSTSTDKTTTTTQTVSASVGVEVDTEGVKATFSGTVGGGYGETDAVTEGTSTSTASTQTSENRFAWSRATTQDTGHAADLVLRVRYDNIGSDSAFDVIPTFNILIGDHAVATFSPTVAINSLTPGGSFPEGGGTVVVDKTSTGDPIQLSMEELSMLGGGAPVTLVLTQINANVNRREDDGSYTTQSWTGYGGAIGAVSGRIVLDDGQGGFREALVYGDDAESAPPVTLAEALVLAGVSVDGGMTAELGHTDGTTTTADISNWRLAFNEDLWATIREDVLAGSLNPFEMRVRPGMVLRMQPAPGGGGAYIYRTWWNGQRLFVLAVDSGYAPELLEVTGTTPSGAPLTFQYDPTTGAHYATTSEGLSNDLVAPYVVGVRNPAGVEADLEPVTVPVPSTNALYEGRATITVRSDSPWDAVHLAQSSTTYGPEGGTAAFGGQFSFPVGYSLRAYNGGSWGVSYFDTGGTYCALWDVDPRTVSPDTLDACFWGDTYNRSLVQQPSTYANFPIGLPTKSSNVVAIRYNNGTRYTIAHILSPKSGTGLPGSATLEWVTYRR